MLNWFQVVRGVFVVIITFSQKGELRGGKEGEGGLIENAWAESGPGPTPTCHHLIILIIPIGVVGALL